MNRSNETLHKKRMKRNIKDADNLLGISHALLFIQLDEISFIIFLWNWLTNTLKIDNYNFTFLFIVILIEYYIENR